MMTKKLIYIILTTLLFIILSYGLHSVIELLILNNNTDVTWYTHFGGLCALHPVISYSLLVLGFFAGFYIGQRWWEWVYIEKRHWRTKNIK